MVEFEQATHAEPLGEGRHRLIVPDGWQHGRGAFGGLTLAALLRAMQSEEPESRAPRTFSGDICGPVLPGEAAIVVQRLRRGSNQTNLRADLSQNGQLQATATTVLSTDRAGDIRILPPAPPAADWRQLDVVPMVSPPASPFTLHDEYRSMGPLFLSGSAEAVAEGFLREKDPPARLDAPALVGRLDAWWPTLYAISDRIRPMATISFLAEFLVDPASIDPAVPLRYRARAVHVRDGFLREERQLWSGEVPVAMNQQTFAILG